MPMPSWPVVLSPQHQRVPLVRVAQVCAKPVVTVAQVLTVPTCRGVVAV
jgi:hypothetical protein